MARTTTRAAKEKEKDEVVRNEVKSLRIIRAYEYEDGDVSFDAEINGFVFYGLTLVRYKKGDFISEPSFKVGKRKKEKWLKHYWLNLSDMANDIVIEAVEQVLEEMEDEE